MILVLLLAAALCLLVAAIMAWVGHPRALPVLALGLLAWVLTALLPAIHVG